MYQFKVNVSVKEHDEFVRNHPLCNLLQSSDWAKVKDNWDNKIVGVYEDGKLVASALVLIKWLPLKFSMFYIPRGPVMDYENERLVSYFMQELRKWAKKYHCLFITMDPAVILRSFTMKEKEMAYDEKALAVIETLKKNKAHFKGFTKEIADTIQARFHMGVYKCEDMDAHVPRSTFRSKNVAVRKHVHIELVGKEGLDDFARIMQLTEERKNVQLRNREYFEELMNIYGDHAYLFLAKVNPADRENELLKTIETTQEQLKDESLGKKARRKLEEEYSSAKKELESMADVLALGREEKVIAGGLMVGFGSEVEMLYAGMDDNYRSFRPQYYTYMTQFEYAFKEGYEYVNMGGVEGSLEDGLSVYKANFNPNVVEYIGEFDLPVNTLLFKASQKAYEVRKKLVLKRQEKNNETN